MQKLPGLINQVKSSANSESYAQAKAGLMEISLLFKGLDTIIPKKGSKNSWDSIHRTIIREAYKGMGACDMMDKKILLEVVDAIVNLKGKGHGLHK